MKEDLKSDEIRFIRKSLGMSQTDFAKALNVTMRTVQNWESSEKPVNHIKSKLIRSLYEKDGEREKTEDQEKYILFRGEKILVSEWATVTAKNDHILEGNDIYDLLWENKTLKALLNIEKGKLKKYAPSIIEALKKYVHNA
ncbi:helix-turn-helix domain-containing protein [Pseudotenacibaculum haliotis]|uniref:Helix-turn-helix domain-containing protein n=1 Tax=Pseudotenacibaculum haliotis TaxID=1862138 RepID=A0ABW5LN75_9FLAO